MDLMEKPKKAKFLFDDDDVDGEGEKDQDKQNNKGNDQGKNETPVNRAKEWPRVNYGTRGLPTEASSKNRSSRYCNWQTCCVVVDDGGEVNYCNFSPSNSSFPAYVCYTLTVSKYKQYPV